MMEYMRCCVCDDGGFYLFGDGRERASAKAGSHSQSLCGGVTYQGSWHSHSQGVGVSNLWELQA